MVKVSPSMLSSDFSKLGSEIEKVVDAGADWIHLDVMDGMFVPNITIGPPVIKALRRFTDIPFDVHLMIDEPIRYIDVFADAGSDYITVHSEACRDLDATIDKIHSVGKKAGISIKPNTPVSDIIPYLKKIELVLVMTVEPGFGGQKFRENGVPKIMELRRYADSNGLSYDISVDGGINRETGKICADAGATVLAAGSYMFKLDDMASEIDLWHQF